MYNYNEFEPEKCEFFPVVNVNEFPNGERLFIEIDEQEIVLFNVAGTYYAIRDVCSHDDGPLGDGDLDGHDIICPRHGARFDIRSGKALTLPAIVDIPAFPTRVKDGTIEIGLPINEN